MVAGQFANIDFWIKEVKVALSALDEHNNRFEKMYHAQKSWIDSHNIEVPDHCSICWGICELGGGSKKPNLPKKTKHTKSEKKASRHELIDSAYFFLIRCYKIGLLEETELRQKCEEVGTSIDFVDLEKLKKD